MTEQASTKKSTYARPELRQYGTLRLITQGSSGKYKDAVQGQPNESPPTSGTGRK